MTRRDLLTAAGYGLTASVIASTRAAAKPSPSEPSPSDTAEATATSHRHPLAVFTKPFNSLSFDELSRSIATLGVQGIEAPVRTGGHIQPDRVQTELPKLVDALAANDLKVLVLTTNIVDADDPSTETQLKVAADLGIRRYRMGYFKYHPRQPIEDQLDLWRSRLAKLAELNQKIGIRGLYQNHAGVDYFGAAVWDLKYALADIDPAQLAVAYDIRHATVEGGTSWSTTFRMIRSHIDTVYVKDFRWDGHRIVDVPLGQGVVDQRFFKLLSASGFTGPISLHQEYLDHADPRLVADHLKAFTGDIATLHTWLEQSDV